jgi:hypothetical protein
MDNISVNYKKVYEHYKQVMRHNELENLRIEIKNWLANEREVRQNQISADDLIIKINQLLNLQKCYLNFVELTENVSFKIPIDEHLLLHKEIKSFLRKLNIDSINDFSNYLELINIASHKINSKMHLSYVFRNVNDIISELLLINIDIMLDSNPSKLRNLLNECIYIGIIDSDLKLIIDEARIKIIRIIDHIDWLDKLNCDKPQYPIESELALLNQLKRDFKDCLYCLKNRYISR